MAARAEAGDAAAASRIFNDVHKCSSVRNAEAELAAQAGTYLDAQTGAIKATVTPEAARGYHSLQNYAEKYREFCAGLSTSQIDSLMPMSLLAAQLGDAGATDCFLNLSPQLDKALAANLDWQAQFNSVALTMAENAVRSGDWNAVRLLAGSYNDPNGFWLLSRSTGTDLAISYRYLKLMQLGLSGGDTAELNIRLENIAKQLTPPIIAQGDSWAGDTYQQFFSDQHPVYAAPNASICPQPD